MNIGSMLEFVFPGGAAPSSAATWSALPAQLAAAVVLTVVCLKWRRRAGKANGRPASKLVWVGIVMALNAISLYRMQKFIVDWREVHGEFATTTPLEYAMGTMVFIAIGLFVMFILIVLGVPRMQKAEPLGYLMGGCAALMLAGLTAKVEFVINAGLGLRMPTAWFQWPVVVFAVVLFTLAAVGKFAQSRPSRSAEGVRAV